jgi:hypothetical protein
MPPTEVGGSRSKKRLGYAVYKELHTDVPQLFLMTECGFCVRRRRDHRFCLVISVDPGEMLKYCGCGAVTCPTHLHHSSMFLS